MQPVVGALLGQELLVGAMLHDLPMIDIEDLVSILDGGQPVGDDEGGPPLEQVGQSTAGGR